LALRRSGGAIQFGSTSASGHHLRSHSRWRIVLKLALTILDTADEVLINRQQATPRRPPLARIWPGSPASDGGGDVECAGKAIFSLQGSTFRPFAMRAMLSNGPTKL